jgi:membrane associated rhomboid family serine protease
MNVLKWRERLVRREPIFNAPFVVVGLLLALALVHVARAFLSDMADAYVVLSLGFIPARYGPELFDVPGGSVASVTSFLTHMFVHGDPLHLLVNSAWLLAFGTPVARRIGSLRFLLFTMVCGVAGALTFLALNPGLAVPMVGASGAVSGLMGGLLRFLFNAFDRGGAGLVPDGARDVPRMDLGQMLQDRRVLFTIGIWVALNFLFSLGFGGIAEPGAIAWEAHLGGFFAGLITFGAFDRRVEPHSWQAGDPPG